MRYFIFLLSLFIFDSYAYSELTKWTVCEGKTCKAAESGQDLYLKHDFISNKATYLTSFKKELVESCSKKEDCWLYLGAVGDTAIVTLNGFIIGKHQTYIHHESLKFRIPSTLIGLQNNLEIKVTDLNQTRFGLRTPNIGIGNYADVNRKSKTDWLLRTGSSLLNAFTLLALMIALIATYGIYKNKKILPIIYLCGVGLLYLISFSEILRSEFDPVLLSGPIHFTLRLLLEMTIISTALSFYKAYGRSKVINYFSYIYLLPISILLIAGFMGIDKYSFHKLIMLSSAPLVIGGGFTLLLLSLKYHEQKERNIITPIFGTFFALQVYDLFVFWEVIPGDFSIKWYLPLLVICFCWIYVRRRINEVRVLKIDAIIGDELIKISHDIAAPIQNLKSLMASDNFDINHSLISKNLDYLDQISRSIIGRYNYPLLQNQTQSSTLLSVINKAISLSSAGINYNLSLSQEFEWYCVDEVLFSRVFGNLFSNSFKADANKLDLTGKFADGYLSLNISDNGSGIPKALQPYLFEKGIKSNNSLGSGLGLNFVKESLDKLGVSIDLVRSRSGETIFLLKFPIKEVVLIDDNDLIKETWAVLSKKAGINLLSYRSSNDFYQSSLKSKNTPIFVDYHIENDTSGLDIVNECRTKGFVNVFLATGQKDKIDSNIQQFNKSFPFNPVYLG